MEHRVDVRLHRRSTAAGAPGWHGPTLQAQRPGQPSPGHVRLRCVAAAADSDPGSAAAKGGARGDMARPAGRRLGRAAVAVGARNDPVPAARASDSACGTLQARLWSESAPGSSGAAPAARPI